MRFKRLAAVLVAAMLGSMTTAGTASSESRDVDRTRNRTWKLSDGTLHQRMAPLDAITNAATPSDVRNGALALRDVYERRASRQQRVTDLLSSVSFIGALGVIPSGRVGDSTQKIWLAGAFLPVLISNHNAFEPTRDLYFAGALAMEMITRRYDTITATQTLLADENLVPRVAPPSCAALPSSHTTLNRELNQMRSACLDLELANAKLEAYAKSLGVQYGGAFVAAPFKADVLALDSVLLDRDRDFRTTPLEAITNIVALAPRTVEFVVSGTNVQQLINDVKIQTALNGMDLTLHRPFLPDLPPEIEDLDLPDDTVVIVERDAQLGGPVKQHRTALDRYNQRRLLVLTLDKAMAATALSFSYDTTNRMVRVELAAPTAPATPLASAIASR